MNVEQLALLGIAIFSFMAIVSLYNALRSYKHSFKHKPMRVRRLIGGKESARSVARRVVSATAEKLARDVEKSRDNGQLTEPLEDALNEARAYFLGRVEPIHRTLFTEAVDEIILGKPSSDDPS